MLKNIFPYRKIACSGAVCVSLGIAICMPYCPRVSYRHFNNRKNLFDAIDRTSVLPVSLSRLCQTVEDVAHTSPVRYMYFLTFHPMACRWQGSGKPSFSEDRRQKSEVRSEKKGILSSRFYILMLNYESLRFFADFYKINAVFVT